MTRRSCRPWPTGRCCSATTSAASCPRATRPRPCPGCTADVPGPLADRAAELDGPGVRRLTRKSAAQRAVTTVGARIGDAWATLVSVGIGLALLGGWLTSVRDAIAGRAPGAGAGLPASVTPPPAARAPVAALTALLDRLGPVSAGPAAAAWWLPLPADRGRLLRTELGRVAAVTAGVTALLSTPVALVASRPASVGRVASTVLGATAAASVLVGAVALLQTRGRGGVLAPVTGAVAVGTGAVAAALAVSPWAADAFARRTRNGLPTVPWPVAVFTAAVAAGVLVAADRGLGRLRAGTLRSSGATSAFAAASAFSLDTRDLGRALASEPRTPRRGRRLGLVRGPAQAVTAADLLLLSRSPWQCGQLVLATAVPVLAARTEGLDRLPAATALGLLVGWSAAGVAVGLPARFAHAAPAIDRLLPLSSGRVVAARCVAPALVLTVVCGLSGLLVGVGSAHPLAWAAIALGGVPAWTAAALRGAYRPDLDWSGAVVATPAGALPAGIGAPPVKGLDVGVAGSIPIVVVVLTGVDPAPALVVVQWLWALCLAAAALTYLARRRPT